MMIRFGSLIAFAAASLACAAAGSAQTPAARFIDSARVEIDRGMRDMDMTRLDHAVVLLDRTLVAFPDDPYALHYRGYAAYLQVVGMMMGGDRANAGPTIARGLADLEKSGDKLPWPETKQLQASLTAFRIALEPGMGPTLGPVTGRLSAEATKLGPDNPRVALLQAYVAEGTPVSMGGGPERARVLAEKAVALFANDHPAPLAPSWGKDEAESLVRRLSKPKNPGAP
jgi:hypothetical protein